MVFIGVFNVVKVLNLDDVKNDARIVIKAAKWGGIFFSITDFSPSRYKNARTKVRDTMKAPSVKSGF